MEQKHKSKPVHKTELEHEAHSTINISKFKIPEKIDFLDPIEYSKNSFQEIGKFPELQHIDTLEKWEDKLKTGKCKFKVYENPLSTKQLVRLII